MDSQNEARLPGLDRRKFIGFGAAAGAAILIGVEGGGADAASLQRNVATLAAKQLQGSVMTAQALGVNTTYGDSLFADAVVPGLLRQAGIGIIRYPGGGGADSYDWRSTTSSLPWPKFMGLMAQIGAAPMITVNYGQLSQGPSSAAGWVASAQSFPNYSSTTAVWVLGNEGYGPWERDEHPDPHTPLSYATNVRPYFKAMHAIDRSTRVGFPMTIDREVAGGTGTWVPDPDLWNTTVLSRNADQVDFIDFHWYPIFGIPVLSNAELFATVGRIPDAVTYLRGIIDKYNPALPILNSESNISQSEIVYNTQPVAALFAVATSLKFLSQGVQSSMWWQVHNADNMNGDFGFLSSATGTPGPSATTLSSPVAVGARNIAVASPTGFYYAHQFTLGKGAAQESRKVTALPGATTLANAAGIGSRNVKVAETSTITTIGATSDYHQFFAAGTPVTIGTGATAESFTVVSAGTGASTAALAAPAAKGDSTVRIVGVGMGGQTIPVFMPTGFVTGGSVTIGTGASAEKATVARIGTSSSLGTTTVADTQPGASTVYVVDVTDTNTGLANYVGDPITIGTGTTEELRTITTVGTGAADPTVLVAPVASGARRIFLASTAGVTAGHPLLMGEGTTGLLVFSVASVGAQASSTLAAASPAGATTLQVKNVTRLTVGHRVAIGTGDGMDVSVIASIATPGSTTTAVTVTPPLSKAHASGDEFVDVGTGVTLTSGAKSAFPAGTSVRDVGTGITVSSPLQKSHPTGSPTRDAGSGLVLTAPLRRTHVDGTVVATPGSGLTLSAPLLRRHPEGDAIVSSGITFTPALGRAHAAGTPLNELGLKEPPLDTPLPAYYGYLLTSKMTAPGARLREVTSPKSTVLAYVSQLGGTASIMLLNTDDTAPVTVRVNGLPASGTAHTYDYGLENPSIVEGTINVSLAKAGVELLPESLKMLVVAVGTAEVEVSLTVR